MTEEYYTIQSIIHKQNSMGHSRQQSSHNIEKFSNWRQATPPSEFSRNGVQNLTNEHAARNAGKQDTIGAYTI